MANKTFTIPDIGNFDTVEVIEIHVKPGDSVNTDDALITLESEKASMDIPATFNGIVQELLLKVGDKVIASASAPVIENCKTFGGTIPSHLSVDTNKTSGQVQRVITRSQIALTVNELLIIEFYSRKG